MTSPSLIDLTSYFGGLSIISIGGASAVIQSMYLELVEQRRWISGDDFANLIALAQAAPGPNVILVALLGWKIGGFFFGLAALASMCIPSSIAAFYFASAWERVRGTKFHTVVKNTLIPISIGLVLSGALALLESAEVNSIRAYLITGCCAILSLRTKTHPLILLTTTGLIYSIANT